MKYFLSLLTCICLTAALYAKAEKTLDIQADEIIFLKNSTAISANRDVIIQYDTTRISAPTFSYNKNDGYVSFPETFSIHQKETAINGTQFFYDLKTYKGGAENLDVKIKNTLIKAENLSISPNKLTFSNAIFTTCNHPHGKTHVSISSKKIYVFPLWGYLVAVNGNVQSQFLPFSIPIPAYVYGAKDFGLSESSSLLPDIGSSKKEGAFIKQKISYFLSQESQGGLLFGWTEKKGSYVGIEHGIKIKTNHDFYVKNFLYSKDSFRGNALYSYSFLKNTKENTDFILDYFNTFTGEKEENLGTFKLHVSERDIINDEIVSMKPLGTLEFNNITLPLFNSKLNSAISYADITQHYETNSISLEEAHLSVRLFRSIALFNYSKIIPEIFYSKYWYPQEKSWERLFSTVTMSFPSLILNPKISLYKQWLKNTGESPFSFRTKFSPISDELWVDINDRINNAFFGVSSRYAYHGKTFRDINIEVGYAFSCWKVSLKWLTKREQILFGFQMNQE
jgi:hypothetical protein